MPIFTILALLIAFYSPCSAMDLPQTSAEPVEKAFDPTNEWRSIGCLAHTRVEWFEQKIKALYELERGKVACLAMAKVFCMNEPLDSIPLTRGISGPKAEEIRINKYIAMACRNLEFSLFFWQFMERTIAHYSSTQNDDPQTFKMILPHISKEMKNFEEFAKGDIKLDPLNTYASKEIIYAQAILDILGLLGDHYDQKVAEKDYFYDLKTNVRVTATQAFQPGNIVRIPGELLGSSNKSLYFMEQLICYRKENLAAQNFAVPLNLNEPKLRGFLAYVLMPSGPAFVQSIEDVVVTAPKQEKSMKSSRGGKKSKAKSAQGKRARNKSAQSQKQKSAQQKPVVVLEEKEEASSTSVETITHNTIDGRPDKQTVLEEVIVTTPIQTTTSTQSTTPLSYVEAVVSMSKATTSSQSLPIRILPIVVPFHKETKRSKSYIFQGQVYPFVHLETQCDQFNYVFLEELTARTFRFNKEGVRNVAKASLNIHYTVEGNSFCEQLVFGELFLSGGKSFTNDDAPFKHQHNIVTACPDLLTNKEVANISSQEHGKKSTYVGVCMERKLLTRIAIGNWGRNHTDSEALVALWLLNKMPSIFRDIVLKHDSRVITIDGLALGIASFFDCCSNCQNLLQCYQGKMKQFILSFGIGKLGVSDNFGTLVTVGGYARPSSINKDFSGMQDLPATLGENSHILVCSPFQLRK